MKKKIKILFVIDGLDTGGAEKLLVNTLYELDKEIFSPTVFLKEFNGTYNKEVRSMGIPLFELHSTKFCDFVAIIKLIRYINNEKIDIVHTNLFGSDIIGRIAGKLANVPLIFSTYLNVYSWKKSRNLKIRIKTWIDKVTAKYFCDKLIAVSEDVRDFHIETLKLNKNKFSVLVPGINLNEFQLTDNFSLNKKKLELGIDINSFVVVVVGVLSEQKGHKYLIEAAPSVLIKYPDTRFLIIGPGPLRQELEQMTKNKGVSNEFIFTGFSENLVDLLAISNVFISCSLWEGLPQTVIEAMAMNKPVIATKVGGLPELIQDGKSGILIPPSDPSAIVDSIISIRENKKIAQNLSTEGRKVVEEYFSVKVMVNKLQELYLKTLESKHG